MVLIKLSNIIQFGRISGINGKKKLKISIKKNSELILCHLK